MPMAARVWGKGKCSRIRVVPPHNSVSTLKTMELHLSKAVGYCNSYSNVGLGKPRQEAKLLSPAHNTELDAV